MGHISDDFFKAVFKNISGDFPDPIVSRSVAGSRKNCKTISKECACGTPVASVKVWRKKLKAPRPIFKHSSPVFDLCLAPRLLSWGL